MELILQLDDIGNKKRKKSIVYYAIKGAKETSFGQGGYMCERVQFQMGDWGVAPQEVTFKQRYEEPRPEGDGWRKSMSRQREWQRQMP